MERAVAHRGKEVRPLLLVVIGVTRCIAYNAKAHKWYSFQIACLRYCSALHVASQAVDEVTLNAVEGFPVSDELVSSTYKTCHQAFAVSERDCECMVEQMLVSVEAYRKALYLTAYAVETNTAVHIMVNTLCGGKDIHNPHQGIYTPGQAGGEDGVRVMLLHQTHGANSSINLAYTTLPKYNLIVAKAASIPAKSIVHLPILDIHGYDNSYLHICMF